jgi:hypothetical protein
VPFSSYAGSAVFLVFWTEGDRQSAQLLRTLGEYEKSGGRPDAAKILNVLVPTAMPEAARGFQAGAGETAFAAAGAAASGTADDAIDATTGAVAGAATETYAPAAAAGAATETAAGSADGADSAANDAPAAATAGAATGAAYPAGGAGDPQGEASAVPDSLLAGYGLAPESSFYDADAALARTFMVAGYPSMFVFSRDGKLVDYIVGATGAGRIQEAARLAEAA